MFYAVAKHVLPMRDATESQAQQKTVKLSVQTEQQSGHV